MRLLLQRERLREARDERGLGQARHADEQPVAAREQRDQQQLDDLLLADDAAPELLDDLALGLGQPGDQLHVFVLGGSDQLEGVVHQVLGPCAGRAGTGLA